MLQIALSFTHKPAELVFFRSESGMNDREGERERDGNVKVVKKIWWSIEDGRHIFSIMKESCDVEEKEREITASLPSLHRIQVIRFCCCQWCRDVMYFKFKKAAMEKEGTGSHSEQLPLSCNIPNVYVVSFPFHPNSKKNLPSPFFSHPWPSTSFLLSFWSFLFSHSLKETSGL